MTSLAMVLAMHVGPFHGLVAAQAEPLTEFRRSTEIEMVGANALLGGVTAGLAALFRGDPIPPAFLQGAAGGSLAYTGKRLAVRSDPGMGLLGRQVAAVGGSVVGNAVAGRGPLDRIAFGFGPMRFYAGKGIEGVDWGVDAWATAAVVWRLLDGGRIDLAKSLSSGAVVLHEEYGGLSLPGTIVLGPPARSDRQAYVLAHEQVHVLQYEQSFLQWGDPFEDYLAGRSRTLAKLLEHVEFNLPPLLAAGTMAVLFWDHDEQPWEQEAMYLSRTR